MTEVPANMANDHRHPLPGLLAEKMSRLFGADFSDVRIAESSLPAACGTIAVAYGEEIHFAPGVIDGWSVTAERILAHELTHVLQYRSGRAEAWPGQFEAQAAVAAAQPELVRTALVGAGPQTLRASPILRTYVTGNLDQLGITYLGRAGAKSPLRTQTRLPRQSFLARDGHPRFGDLEPGNVRYRLSENEKWLIEDCDNNERQAKVVFATIEALDDANHALADRKIKLRISSPMASFRNRHDRGLFQVVPDFNVSGSHDATRVGVLSAVKQDCAAFSYDECGVPQGRDGYATVAEFMGERVPEVQQVEWMSEIARRFASSPLRTNLSRLKSAELNEYANPSVGEAFYSASIVGFAEGDPNLRVYYDYSIPGSVREVVTGSRVRVIRGVGPGWKDVKQVWGDHVGAVVASDGADRIVIQNYSRLHEDFSQTEEGPDSPLHYFQMYSVVSDLNISRQGVRSTWHQQWDQSRYLRPAEGPSRYQPFAGRDLPIVLGLVADGRRVLLSPVTMALKRDPRP